jgi:hypothetical protein
MFQIGKFYEFRLWEPGNGVAIKMFAAKVIEETHPLITCEHDYLSGEPFRQIIDTASTSFIAAELVERPSGDGLHRA